MTVVFFSNVLNNHQIALCDAFYSQLGVDFAFVEIKGIEEARLKMGFTAYDRSYKIDARLYKEKAIDLAKNADVAIMGAESFDYLKIRIKESAGLTFSFSERWLKQGLKNILSPTLLRQAFLYFALGRRRKWYMLCASGYLASDLNKFSLFKGKCFKWGYFPKYSIFNQQKRLSNTVKILWVGRFINWKHPEIMIALGEMLYKDGYDFEITMIGDGVMMPHIKELLDKNTKLKEKFHLTGNLPNVDVISKMKESDVLCFTSDRQEGWGVTLAEGMSTGCCVVASSDAGATPFLIKERKNGLVFKSGNIHDLYKRTKSIIDNPASAIKMAHDAQQTIHNHWSAPKAVSNFIYLSKALLDSGHFPQFVNEPCQHID